MAKRTTLFLLSVMLILSCNSNKDKKQKQTSFLSAKEVVLLNQIVYKENIPDTLSRFAPEYDLVFNPDAVSGNYAMIVKKKNNNQFALVIRGSMIEFSNAGFQNFFLQDFNIFNLKKWSYTDSVKDAYISNGAYEGFNNLLQLKDKATGIGIKDYMEQKIPVGSSLVITGHSLGGNLAYPLAGYLKKILPDDKKNLLQLITFGAPAVGNAAFIQDMEEKFPHAERYAIDKDIAPSFPDNDKMGVIAKVLGLDSVLHIKEVSLTAGDLLNIAGDILEKTKIINSSNKYVQSQKQLRLLHSSDEPIPSGLTTEAVFNRAYQYHKIDAYALLLGGKVLN